MSFTDFERRVAQLEQQVAMFRPSEAMVMAPKGQVVTPGGVLTTQGPYLPTIGADGGGGAVWNNPGRITADDGSSADTPLTNAPNTSGTLSGTAFGFNLPGGSIIQGIQLDIKCQTQGGTDPGSGIVFGVLLLKGGVQTGSNLATNNQLPTAALTYVTFGGPSNLWGATWTAGDINATNFGAVFVTKAASPPLPPGHTCNPLVDAMRITITYISP